MSAPSLSDLWSAVVDLHGWLLGVIGRPAAFLARRELTRAERDEALAQLRPLEALLRRLLAHMALTFIGPLRPPTPARGRRGARAARPRWPGADPAQWPGVRFTALPQPSRRASGTAAPRREIFSPLAIARRMEAVARVIAAPERYARRLAYTLRTQTKTRLRAWRLAAASDRQAARCALGAAHIDAAGALLAQSLSPARLDSG
ncbi:MAG: hypothetical protein GC206_05500 [Alphaproteobacteria bacterium]|nr:hypothetical protein [Alphaproteobacteria bacterium]